LHSEEKWYKINKIRALDPDAMPTIVFGSEASGK